MTFLRIFIALIIFCYAGTVTAKPNISVFGNITPSVQIDFLSGTLPGFMTASGAANGTTFNAAGNLVAAVAPRFYFNPWTGAPLGLLVEEARTNVVLWNRDLTNAVWTAVNVTTSETQTGIDGVSNSATLLTAGTCGTCTILQTITKASSTDVQSAYIKCVTCTGVISMTEDNTTYTALTSSNCFQGLIGVSPNTSTWVRCQIPSQTALVNPVIGFKFANTSDSIIVDFVQNETPVGLFVGPTSPIATTSASVTRTADSIGGPTSSLRAAGQGSIAVKFLAEASPQANAASVFEGAAGSGAVIDYGSSGTFVRFLVKTGTAASNRSDFNNGGSPVPGTAMSEGAVSWGTSSLAASLNGSQVLGAATTAESEWASTFVVGLGFNGWIQGFAIYNVPISQRKLNELTKALKFR